MNKLIPIEERQSKLIEFGAPKPFIENIGKIPELEFSVENVEGAYFYFPTITNYKILSGLNIIPIYDSGESFYVFGYNELTQKIFHFELENDEIYNEYGTNWNLLLLEIMINLFDQYIDTDIDKNRFIEIGKKIGFAKSSQLFDLKNIPIDEYNEKFQNNQQWEIEIAEKLEIL